MPTHEPELSEPYYQGDFYPEGPGASIEYRYTEDDGFSYDPDAPGELEWQSDPVASDADLNWSNEAERRLVGMAILTHHLRHAPTDDEIDLFMSEIAPTLEDGIPFAIGVNSLDAAGLRA
jgi:hypothetical protein